MAHEQDLIIPAHLQKTHDERLDEAKEKDPLSWLKSLGSYLADAIDEYNEVAEANNQDVIVALAMPADEREDFFDTLAELVEMEDQDDRSEDD